MFRQPTLNPPGPDYADRPAPQRRVAGAHPVHSITHLLKGVIFTAALIASAFSALAQQESLLPPGPQLLAQVRAEQASTLEAITEIVTALASVMPEDARKLLREHPGDAAALLMAMQANSDTVAAIRQLSQDSPEKTFLYATLGMRLFPLQSHDLYRQLKAAPEIDQKAVYRAADGLKFDHRLPQLAELANSDGVLIVPLFHSASVTLFGQPEDVDIRTEYRPKGGNWTQTHPLQWDPVAAVPSGSIVRLQAETEYELRATISRGGERLDVVHASFRTWDEQPPIDPEKVYRLKDIYKGGTLDLTALGIQGSANGWAKIVGDAETPIVAEDGANEALRIGGNSYLLFENITVRGGRHAITADSAHHLRFSGCDISGWGRKPEVVRNGIAYESEEATHPINLDAGFALFKSGTVVVEKCRVHSPRPKANHWGVGHPRGATAYLADANHPDPAFQGQVVIRNNHFSGTQDHRFNDVIESLANGRVWGGFVRDSAIHDNYLAYANDDLIEIDGGQSNVLVYNNEMEQGFCGISAIPNMRGPSFIFNNHIHNLGDERQYSWCAIKLGGLYSAPAGVVNIFSNLIQTSSNGLTYAGLRGDSTFWVDARHNAVISSGRGERTGFVIFDIGGYPGSNFINNHFFQTENGEIKVSDTVDAEAQVFRTLPTDEVSAANIAAGHLDIRVKAADLIKNFSEPGRSGHVVTGIVEPSRAE